MCTITYIAYKNGYILTQNRDESPLRQDAVFPVKAEIGGEQVIYPQDPEGSGSWFVSTQSGTTICVMNGIFHPDKKPGQYRHSRGLIPLHYLHFEHTRQFLKNYEFNELEGFKLLVCNQQGVDEITWDEERVSHQFHQPQNLIFQSDPLYNAEQKAFRTGLFTSFLQKHEAQNILDFHTEPQTADPTVNILMDRKMVKSVSTIQRHFLAGQNQVGYLKLGEKEMAVAEF